MGVRLPAKYQEVEYITGIRQKQFINTGISGDNDGLVIEARVKPGGYVQYAPLWGNYQAENYKCTRLIATEMTGQIYSYINTKASNGTNRISYSLFNGNNIYDIRQEKTKVIINGTAYITTSVSSGLENTTPIAINASRIDPNPPASDYLQSFYYFRISDGETVLIDLVPCYRKSDDKPGMYDLVTKQFFTNAGTGEFTVGPDVIDSISPWLFARRRLLMQKKTARLPAEYQEVEYLETSQTGSQYINSGVAITEDLVFEIDFQLPNVVRSRYFMGTYNGTDFYLYVGYVSQQGGEVLYFQTAFGATWQNTTLLADTQRHKFTYQFENGNLVVKDSNTTILTKAKGSFSERSILVVGTSQYQSARTPCRTYESKMTKSGVVIQDLIPCYRKADDTPGMYDLVSNTFFTNAGTGEFIVGADIN